MEKKYASHVFILNLIFNFFYSNKTLLIFLLKNICNRKKWLTSGRRSSRKPESLLVSALYRDLHNLPSQVWPCMTLMLLWEASVVVTWKGSDVSLHAWHHKLVLVLLLLIVRLWYQLDLHPIDSNPWACTSTRYGDVAVVTLVSPIHRVECSAKLPAAPYAADVVGCATTTGTSSRPAWWWGKQ